MRCINVRYLLTYLLTYSVQVQRLQLKIIDNVRYISSADEFLVLFYNNS